MELYVCWGVWRRATPWPFRRANRHPCGLAHEALENAGYEPRVVRCLGWEALPSLFNQTPGRRRVKDLTGQIEVPVLLLDSGETVVGSHEIAAWAKQDAVGHA